MTRIMKKTPAILFAVIVAAAMVMAIGILPQKAYAANDEYGVWIDFPDCRGTVLPGESVKLRAEAWHDNWEGEEPPQDNFIYKWSMNDAAKAFARLETNDENAVVIFDELKDQKDFEKKAKVTVTVTNEKGKTLCKCTEDVWVCDDFFDVYPLSLDKNLGVGESVSMEAEVRHLTRETPEGEVIDNSKVKYKWTEYNKKVLKIEGAAPNFQITRLKPGNASCALDYTVTDEEGTYGGGRGYDFAYLPENIDEFDVMFDGQPDYGLYYVDEGSSVTPQIVLRHDEYVLPTSCYTVKVEKSKGWDKNDNEVFETWTGALIADPKGTRNMNGELTEGTASYRFTFSAASGSGYKGKNQERYVEVFSRSALTPFAGEVTLEDKYMRTRTDHWPFAYGVLPLGTTTVRPIVKVDGKTLDQGKDYEVTGYIDQRDDQHLDTFPTKAGGYWLEVEGKGDYYGINNALEIMVGEENPMTVSVKTVTVKASKLKKKAVTVKPLTVKNSKGKVRYWFDGSNAKLKINKKTGKITVKKGTKRGTYRVAVWVSDSGSGTFAPKDVLKTVTVKVK